ncbi:enoyl-CoA hydratase/isomerase family protein [Deinococcus sp.]|uniref:enoyl-CoA hydratase/isomerase family protein n=1 Tax=Deinococcus sp. TaxID=47478 RepID=UPI003CC61B7C
MTTPPETSASAPDRGEVLFTLSADGVATLTLSRPHKLNAVTSDMARQLFALADDLNRDPAVRVVVVRGAGERAFCAGSDITLLDDYGSNWDLRNRRDYCSAIWGIRKPVIAQIHGSCMGGGLELAMMCDIRVSAHSARYAASEARWGWNGGAGNTQLLPRLVGAGKALQMLLTAQPIDAQEAHRCGLVQELVADDALEETVNTLARQIAQNPLIALQTCKHLVRVSESTSLEVGLAYENDLFAYCMTTEDAQEGRRAFAEKRPPVYKGR